MLKRILAVGAHPDDLEIQMAGTLIKYAQAGCHVVMAIATDGSAGHMLIPADELAEIRKKEASDSAGLIGAQSEWMGLKDELLANDIETRLKFVDLIRKTKPDIIFTHSPDDYHPDHCTLSQLIFDASFLSGLPNVETRFEAHLGVQPLYYFDTMAGIKFQPTEYVDISDVIDKKSEMLSKHESQIKWLKDHDNMDMIKASRIFSEYRGMQCGVPMAEGFRSETSWPRIRTYRILP